MRKETCQVTCAVLKITFADKSIGNVVLIV